MERKYRTSHVCDDRGDFAGTCCDFLCHGDLEDKDSCLVVLTKKVASTDHYKFRRQSLGCIEIIIGASKQYHNRLELKQQHKRKHNRLKVP